MRGLVSEQRRPAEHLPLGLSQRKLPPSSNHPTHPPQGMHADIVVLTRLIPDAHGTSCNERLEPISGCRRARILRVPFRDKHG